MDEKALEAALKEWSKPNERREPIEIMRAAIAAYEAALWRPVSEHDGSRETVLLEYEARDGSLHVEVAWYDPDEQERGWWPDNLDFSDYHADSFEANGCIPRRFRPLPTAPEGK